MVDVSPSVGVNFVVLTNTAWISYLNRRTMGILSTIRLQIPRLYLSEAIPLAFPILILKATLEDGFTLAPFLSMSEVREAQHALLWAYKNL